MSSTFPKLPFLGNPQVTINMNNKSQQEFKIQTPDYLVPSLPLRVRSHTLCARCLWPLPEQTTQDPTSFKKADILLVALPLWWNFFQEPKLGFPFNDIKKYRQKPVKLIKPQRRKNKVFF
jgi:hypothetical protein